MEAEANAFLDVYNKDQQQSTTQRLNTLAPLFTSICESSLPASEKYAKRLAHEAFVMISAGGETTARVLAFAVFHISTNPAVLKRLRSEIMTIMPDAAISPSFRELEGLPYLVR